MFRFLVLLLFSVVVRAFPFPQSPEDLPQDVLRDFLAQQAFDSGRRDSPSPVYRAEEEPQYQNTQSRYKNRQPQYQNSQSQYQNGQVQYQNDQNQYQNSQDQNIPDEKIIYEETPVETTVEVEESPPRSRSRLLPRGRNLPRRLPNGLNRIPSTNVENIPPKEEQPPQEETIPPQKTEVEIQEPPRATRRGSRFPVRGNRLGGLRGRLAARKPKKPATTEAPPEIIVNEYETDVPAVTTPEEQDYYYDSNDGYEEEQQQPKPTTLPPSRGLLARRRERGKTRNALLEALRNRRRKLSASTTRAPTIIAEDGSVYVQEVPVEKPKPISTKRFGRPRPKFISRQRLRPTSAPIAAVEPQNPEAQNPEAQNQDTTVQKRNNGFRSRFRSHE